MIRKIVVMAALSFMLLAPSITWAWSSDPNVNTRICPAAGDQYYSNMVHDGAGGAIIAWQGSGYLNAQRVDASGASLWTPAGIPVSPGKIHVEIDVPDYMVSDGAHGAIMVFQGLNNDNPILYAQRINQNGAVQWAEGGVPVSTLPRRAYSRIDITSDGANGAIIVFACQPEDSVYAIYAQRINANGETLWSADGLAIAAGTVGSYASQAVVSDGDGGAIIIWQDLRDDSNAIYAQRVNTEGVLQWTTDSLVYQGTMLDPYKMAGDGNGGAFIAWAHAVVDMDNVDISAQHIMPDGSLAWGSGGVPISADPSQQDNPAIINDGAGGAIIAWHEYRFDDPQGYSDRIFGQRVNAAGTVAWEADGKFILDSYAGGPVQLVSDNFGGAIVTSQMYDTTHYNDISAQRILNDGTLSWGNGGVVICSAPGTQRHPRIVGTGTGDAIIAWEDYRSDIETHIYAQIVSSSGSLSGLQAPSNLSPSTGATTGPTPDLTASPFVDSYGLLTHAASQWRLNDFNSITPDTPEFSSTDDSSFRYALPFAAPFPFFGRQITSIHINPNGLIELLEDGESDAEGTSSGTHAAGRHIDKIDAIFASNDNLYIPQQGYLRAFNCGDHIMIEWSCTTFADDLPIPPLNFQVLLYRDGRIQWNFKEMIFTQTSYDMFSGLCPLGEEEIEVGSGIDTQSSYVFDPGAGTISQVSYSWDEPQQLMYDSGETDVDLNSHTIPTIAGLADGITYHWGVRYKASSGEWTKWSTLTDFIVDALLPEVIATLPEDGSEDVVVNATIQATFSEVMDPATITKDNFTLSGLGPDQFEVSLSTDGRTATLTPDNDLVENTVYTVTITEGVTDITGKPLASDFQWNLTTGTESDTTTPTVTSVSPGVDFMDVSIDIDSIDVFFSEPMNTTFINTSSFTVSVSGGDSLTAESYDYLPGSNKVSFMLPGNLSYDTIYTVELTADIQDLAGNHLNSSFWNFTTIEAPPGEDSIEPTVTGVIPLNNAGIVPIVSVITATFSEPMIAADFTDVTFTVSDSSGPITGSYYYDAPAATIRFQPTYDLAYGTTYYVLISSNVRDLAGNSLAGDQDYGWQFTTSLDPNSSGLPCDPENGHEEGCESFSEFTFGTGARAGVDVVSTTGPTTIGSARKDVTHGVPLSEDTVSDDEVHSEAVSRVDASAFRLYVESLDKVVDGKTSGAVVYGASKIEVTGVPWGSLVPMSMTVSPSYLPNGVFTMEIHDFEFRALGTLYGSKGPTGYSISRITWSNPYDQDASTILYTSSPGVLGKLDFLFPVLPNNGIFIRLAGVSRKFNETDGNAKFTCTASLTVEPAPGVTVTLPSGLTFQGGIDTDGDGVNDTIDTSPGDASEATPEAATGTGKIEIDVDNSSNGGIVLSQCKTMKSSAFGVNQEGKPADQGFPDGLVSFQVNGVPPGGTVEVTLTFPTPFPDGYTYYKVNDSGFYEFSGAVFDENANTVTLTLVDGGSGDHDNAANGVIVDPGGVAGPVVPCDINGDGVTDLADAILAIQITIQGVIQPSTINVAADINGDGRIGMTEAVYILRISSE